MAQWGKCLQYVNQTLAPVVKKKKNRLDRPCVLLISSARR